MMFADFTGDKMGDVILGLDDDGDAGKAWIYTGTGTGTFTGTSTEVFDINTGTAGGDLVGRTRTAKAYDFNFDGNMDVILGYNYVEVSKPPSKLVIFFGKGNGTFGPETQIGASWPGNEANRFQAPQRLCPWYQ